MSVSSIFQEASFALFDGLRALQDVPLDLGGDLRVTCLRPVDPATCGLAFTASGDAALELVLQGPDGAQAVWVHAATDARGPLLSVYFEPQRPVMQLRFAPPLMAALEDQRFLLRERPTFPSHDGLQEQRKRLVSRLAPMFRLSQLGGWLHLGTWDALDRSWQPEVARRVLAAAVVLERARQAEFDGA